MKFSVQQRWLLVAARKEQNPYVQAEILYQALNSEKPVEKKKHDYCVSCRNRVPSCYAWCKKGQLKKKAKPC